MTPLFEVKLDESNVLKALDSLEAKATGPVVMEALKAAAEVIRDTPGESSCRCTQRLLTPRPRALLEITAHWSTAYFTRPTTKKRA